MQPAYTHTLTRARQVIAALCICMSLSAQTTAADRDLFDAYKAEDMSIWKTYIDTAAVTPALLSYEYGYCGAMTDSKDSTALTYIQRFRRHIECLKDQLPAGHYEMYMSAVYVYELRLHASFHPVTAMTMAKEAVNKAPEDPMTICYYATSLYYAPKAFGDKKKAKQLFEKAKEKFQTPAYLYSWWRPFCELHLSK